MFYFLDCVNLGNLMLHAHSQVIDYFIYLKPATLLDIQWYLFVSEYYIIPNLNKNLNLQNLMQKRNVKSNVNTEN